MTEPTRLFDCIAYQLQNTPLQDMFAAKEDGVWRKYSTTEVAGTVNKISEGLLSLGISEGNRTPEGRDKVAIISRNRPEWLMVDLAVQQVGAVPTPIYPTVSINDLEFILNDAEVKVVFVNDAPLAEKLGMIKSRLPHLKEIFSFDKVAGVKHWSQLLAMPGLDLADRVASIAATVTTDDLATVIYTSGTTGTPKGVMLSHQNIVSNVLASIPCFPPE